MSSEDVPTSPKFLRFFEVLGDGQWHSIGEIAERVNVGKDKIEKVCELLSGYGLVEREGEKVKQGPLLLRCEQTS